MATFNVQMLANNPPEWENPRPVQVPDAKLLDGQQSLDALLELIFHCGQNEIQARKCCSVSMGDVAEVDGKTYICQTAGWTEISAADLAEYKLIERRDRSFSKFVRPA
jgi:hypothetical protein